MRKHSLFVAILTCSFSLSADPDSTQEGGQDCPMGAHHIRASVRHIEAGGIGYNNGYTTLEAFVAQDPLLWEVMPFLDLRGHVFNDGRLAANAGIGGRAIWGCRAYGLNVYYDYRNGHHKGYSQVGAGFETLGSFWDLRLNGYLPLGGKVSHPFDLQFAAFSGHSILVNRKFEYSMKGLDGEVGFHFGKTSDFDFYAAIGPYYFKGNMGSGAMGGKVRLAGYYKDRVTMEIMDSYDSVFKNNFQGQLTFSFPLGPKSKSENRNRCSDTCDFANTLIARMVQPVNRQEIVVLDTHKKKTTASGYVVFVNNLNGSNGTFEDPYATLADAETNSSPGDIIYVFPGDGTTTGMDAGITLQNNQKLWGSGVSHTLETNLGTITIPPYSTTAPRISHSGGTAVEIAANNELSGLIITSPSIFGISGINPGNLSLLSTTISDTTTATEIFCLTGTTSNVLLDQVSFIDTQSLAFHIEVYDTSIMNVTIRNSSFTGGGSNPIDMESFGTSTTHAVIANNQFSGNSQSLFFLPASSSTTLSTFFVDGNVFSDTTDNSIIYLASGSMPIQCVMSNNYFTNNTNGAAFTFGNTGNSSFSWSNNTTNQTSSGNGFQLTKTNSGTLTATIFKNKFTNNSGSGCVVTQNNAGSTICLDMVGNTSSNNSGTGNYVLTNTAGIAFNVAPCNADSVNEGGLFDHTTGTITQVSSCPSGAVCSP